MIINHRGNCNLPLQNSKLGTMRKVNTILRLSDRVPNFVVKREEKPKKSRNLWEAGQS